MAARRWARGPLPAAEEATGAAAKGDVDSIYIAFITPRTFQDRIYIRTVPDSPSLIEWGSLSRLRRGCPVPVPARIVADATRAFVRAKIWVASFTSDLREARARRLAEEREFYRKLGAYCRANGISPTCEDDWKTGA